MSELLSLAVRYLNSPSYSGFSCSLILKVSRFGAVALDGVKTNITLIKCQNNNNDNTACTHYICSILSHHWKESGSTTDLGSLKKASFRAPIDEVLQTQTKKLLSENHKYYASPILYLNLIWVVLKRWVRGVTMQGFLWAYPCN